MRLPAAVVLAAAAAAVAGQQQHGDDDLPQINRLRDPTRIDSLAPGASVQAAAQLHGLLADRAHAIRGLAGLPRKPALALPASGAQAPPASGSAVISPSEFGADPTGQRDSSPAMAAAMARLHELCQMQRGHLSFNVTDCGGATLDLEGGTYLLTAPVRLPAGGNMHISGGSLRAAATFPRDRWLLESSIDCLWRCTPGSDCKFWNTSVLCHQDISLVNIYFDAGHVAAGGLLLNNSMGCVISQSYFIGFVHSGINIQGGHEMLIDKCWLGETWWDEPPPLNQSSIGILIDGNDHVVTDSIIFAYTSIGIEVNSPGTMLHNIHVWNGLHKVKGLGPGIHLGPGGTATRISDCYLDNTWLNIVDPSRVTVSDVFFYQANTVLVAGPRSSIAGLVMRGNIYSGPLNSSNVHLAGEFQRSAIKTAVLDDEVRLQGPMVATSVSLSAMLVEAASARLVFHGNASQPTQLLFPWIDAVEYSVVFAAGGGRFVQHYAEVAANNQTGEVFVDIRFEEPVSATVYVTATQGL